jgi:uncharacterized membrane protein required for colicin V production
MWYDIAVLGVLVYFMAKGASRGLIWQFATIAGIVLCFMFAETFSGIVGPHITIAAPYNEWVTMFAAYLFFSFIAFGAARVLTKSIEQAGLKEYNAHLGAILGLAKGAVLCLVMTFFLATLTPTHEIIRNSRSGYYAALTMQKIHPIMPEKLHDALNKYIHSLDNIPGIGPLDHDHQIDPNVGLADAIRDAANAVDDKLGNPFVNAPSAPPVSRPPYDPFGPPPANGYQNGVQPTQPGYISSIPAGARSPVQPNYGTNPYAPPTQPGGTPQYNSIPNQPAPATDFWSEVRGAFGAQARQALAESLQNMDPATQQALQKQILESLRSTRSEDLPQLERQLMQSGAQALPGLLSRWGGSTPTPNTPAASATNEREQLLVDVSQLRSSFPQIQIRLQSELRGLMSGIPDNVAVAVLKDWKADLSNDRANDPDRATDINTSVEQRILQQMTRNGVRLDQLDPALRERLSSGANSGAQLR